MSRIQFKMADFWHVMLKGKMLQYYATTKYPSEDSEKFYAKGQGMIDGLKQVFGKEFVNDIEKSLTVQFATRMAYKFSPKFFEEEAEQDKRNLSYLFSTVLEIAQQYSSDFERVKIAMINHYSKEK